MESSDEEYDSPHSQWTLLSDISISNKSSNNNTLSHSEQTHPNCENNYDFLTHKLEPSVNKMPLKITHSQQLWNTINTSGEDLLIESDLSQIARLASSLGVSLTIAPESHEFNISSRFPNDSPIIGSHLSRLMKTLRSLRRSILFIQEIETLSSGYLLVRAGFGSLTSGSAHQCSLARPLRTAVFNALATLFLPLVGASCHILRSASASGVSGASQLQEQLGLMNVAAPDQCPTYNSAPDRPPSAPSSAGSRPCVPDDVQLTTLSGRESYARSLLECARAHAPEALSTNAVTLSFLKMHFDLAVQQSSELVRLLLTLHLLDSLVSSTSSTAAASCMSQTSTSHDQSTSVTSTADQCLLCALFSASLPELARECERAELELRTAILLVYACELPACATTTVTTTGGAAPANASAFEDANTCAPEALAVVGEGGGGCGVQEMLLPGASAENQRQSASASGNVSLSESRQALRSLALHLKLAFDGCVALEKRLDSMCSSSDEVGDGGLSAACRPQRISATAIRELHIELGDGEVASHVLATADCFQIASASLAAAERAFAEDSSSAPPTLDGEGAHQASCPTTEQSLAASHAQHSHPLSEDATWYASEDELLTGDTFGDEDEGEEERRGGAGLEGELFEAEAAAERERRRAAALLVREVESVIAVRARRWTELERRLQRESADDSPQMGSTYQQSRARRREARCNENEEQHEHGDEEATNAGRMGMRELFAALPSLAVMSGTQPARSEAEMAVFESEACDPESDTET